MKNKQITPIKIALYGMDGRTYKTMVMYLQGPCRGLAVVTEELDAEIDLIDADHIKAKDILEEQKSKTPERPVILLSLQKLSIEGTIFVKKPIETAELIAALNKAKAQLHGELPAKPADLSKASSPSEESVQTSLPATDKKPAVKKNIDREEKKKTSKHRTAMDLTESGFSAYLGHTDGIDFSDREQVLTASYNPKNYFLEYVQFALKTAAKKGRILQLNSSWKPLIIFPHTREIWLDADDKQLRAFAGVEIKKGLSKGMALGPVKQSAAGLSKNMENFHDANTFAWKLALWTSKGRYPDSIDINRPVYLKRWPNFTRLIITPHALQIAALLIIGPRTLINIADSLKIKPQYVFVFISAASAIGLVAQVERKVDEVIAPPEIKPTKSKGLLTKIIGRLRS